MTDAAHNQHWETRRPSDRDDCGEQKARRALSLRRTPPSIRAERRRFKFASPDAGAIRMGQHDGMPDPEIRPRLWDGTPTPGCGARAGRGPVARSTRERALSVDEHESPPN